MYREFKADFVYFQCMLFLFTEFCECKSVFAGGNTKMSLFLNYTGKPCGKVNLSQSAYFA